MPITFWDWMICARSRERRWEMPLYSSAESLADVGRMFPYACTGNPLGRGAKTRVASDRAERISDFQLQMSCRASAAWADDGLWLCGEQHGGLPDGLRRLPEDVIESIRGVPVLVLDALRHRPHPAHLTIEAALEIATRVGPGLTWLTHLCHEVDHETTEAGLPQNVRLAYDQLQIEVNNGECFRMP